VELSFPRLTTSWKSYSQM